MRVQNVRGCVLRMRGCVRVGRDDVVVCVLEEMK